MQEAKQNNAIQCAIQSKAPATTMTQFTLVETEPAASQQTFSPSLLPAGFPKATLSQWAAEGFPKGYSQPMGREACFSSTLPVYRASGFERRIG